MKTFKEYQQELKFNIEHAPAAVLNTHATHQGFWLPVEDGDLYICSVCAGRILNRGFALPNATPCYENEPHGVCAVCSDDEATISFPYRYMGKLTKATQNI